DSGPAKEPIGTARWELKKLAPVLVMPRGAPPAAAASTWTPCGFGCSLSWAVISAVAALQKDLRHWVCRGQKEKFVVPSATSLRVSLIVARGILRCAGAGGIVVVLHLMSR